MGERCVYKVTIADRPGNGGGTEVDQLLYFSLRPDQINLLFLLKHVAQLLFHILFSVGPFLRRKSPSNNKLIWCGLKMIIHCVVDSPVILVVMQHSKSCDRGDITGPRCSTFSHPFG